MRLIDADALEQKFSTTRHYLTKDLVLDAVYEINKAPIIDPVKHGHWIDTVADGWFKCSNCGEPAISDCGNEKHNYCPNCGAKMDGEL